MFFKIFALFFLLLTGIALSNSPSLKNIIIFFLLNTLLFLSINSKIEKNIELFFKNIPYNFKKSFNEKGFSKIINFLLIIFFTLLIFSKKFSSEIIMLTLISLLGTLCIISFFIKNKSILVNINILSISILISLFFGNILFEFLLSKKIDMRDKWTYYNEEKDNFKNSLYPWTGVFAPSKYNMQSWDKQPTVISNLSNSNILFCNEVGKWQIYKSDRYGFNNKNDIYEKNFDGYLIGDSYTEGMCVERKNNIQGGLKELNKNYVNLGMSGTGQLAQFAIYKLFAKEHKKTILWIYSAQNDLFNLDRMVTHKPGLMTSYLNDDLIDHDLNQIVKKQDKDIQTELKNIYMNKKSFNHFQPGMNTFSKKPIILRDYITLKATRKKLGDIVQGLPEDLTWRNRNNPKQIWFQDHYPVFQSVEKKLDEIFSAAAAIAKKRNQEIIFVYNPMWETVGPISNYTKEHVINLAKKYFEKIIDLEIMLDKYEDKDLFPTQRSGHYSKNGYKLISSYINENS